ncbi:hypothetical protein AJ80_04463 [Polytolypa hystricis UAMH7299]|uniref:Nop14-like family protein n=1 Tax=Polytolypa hystricis (strain UAMH7299) TaxID=1447883 RepID=A0A2B7YBT4_POLH7|nr:hypothetical protein AJ80_04463 [Polytolypa hystricis UAMH7299]
MAPSQLKQLKASLREHGILGPQQSKKQKKRSAKSGATGADRIQRNVALQGIREQFNPFEARAPSRPAKFEVTTRSKLDVVRARPGVTKGLGEERRRETLLKEMQSRGKVGTLLDRRFGENDPTMTPEERAAERFARESQRKFKKDSLFNLEDDDEEEIQLTHLGKSLDFDVLAEKDDFQEDDLNEPGEDDEEGGIGHKRKRIAEEDDMDGMAEDSEEEVEPERKKTKNEVMKEVIEKSKFYKYERQKAKEDDDDLRTVLDKGLPDIFEMMRGIKRPTESKPAPAAATPNTPFINPDRAALQKISDPNAADKEYDVRVRQMTYEQKSKPSDRTKTEEEKATEEAGRLKQLENERLRRMRGEDLDEDGQEGNVAEDGVEGDESELDDAKAFGFRQTGTTGEELGVEDEDDFIIDSDLVDTGSEGSLDLDDSDISSQEESEDDHDDEEFVGDLVLSAGSEAKTPGFTITIPSGQVSGAPGNSSLAFTYPYPESHEQFLEILKDVRVEDLPTVVQRIRALYNPKLRPDNKAKMGTFSEVLVQHIIYLADQEVHPPFAVFENLLRHIHSLARTHPDKVAAAFRVHLRGMANERPLSLLPADLIILTGVATIFPTSDHFHAVVTPSILSIARYLGQSTVSTLGDLSTGAYCASLCLQYQTLSKRYIPEFINYILNALLMLAPSEPKNAIGFFPVRGPSTPLHLAGSKKPLKAIRKLRFWDVTSDASGKLADAEAQALKLSLISTFVSLLDTAADLWSDKSAFSDIFKPTERTLKHLKKSTSSLVPTVLSDQIQKTLDKLQHLLKQADLTRRPLLLHNHRPLAIKTAIPKFEESFNPDRHYDPDRERAELNKLKAEHKRERKGAMRELRKDANFMAREELREKRDRDAEYERKYRKLVAEIQSEEGREANAYERERRSRKGKR